MKAIKEKWFPRKVSSIKSILTVTDINATEDVSPSIYKQEQNCCGMSSKEKKIIFMLTLVLSYFFVEIFVGYLYNSLALVADACHMLSDGLCLIVGLIAINVSKRSANSKVLKEINTFGWGRAEVLGALINAVFLLALCVIIILESVQKFIQPEAVEQPRTVCIVGAVGLVMNILGLFLFHGDGTMHGHSHGSEEVDHSHHIDANGLESTDSLRRKSGSGHGHSHEHGAQDYKGHSDEHDNYEPGTTQAEQLNMKGIFLHVLGDAVGSVVVILSALLMYFFNNCDDGNDAEKSKCMVYPAAVECGNFLVDERGINQTELTKFLNSTEAHEDTVRLMFPEDEYHWTLYVDPITSLILTALILFTTLKLLRVPVMILLQTSPRNIDLEKLQLELIKAAKDEYQTDINIHHLHVWTLTGEKIVGTVHIKLFDLDIKKFQQIVGRTREIFHNYGIHYLTMQPEFAEVRVESLASKESIVDSEQCLLVCCDEAN